MKKRLFSLILAFALLLSAVPTVFAATHHEVVIDGVVYWVYPEEGYAEIRNVFNITGVGRVAGCMVTEGMVKRGAKVRLLRDNVVIHDGSLGQLKRFKDDVKEVKEGYECGMSFENYNDIQVGDFIECYEIETIAAKLA